MLFPPLKDPDALREQAKEWGSCPKLAETWQRVLRLVVRPLHPLNFFNNLAPDDIYNFMLEDSKKQIGFHNVVYKAAGILLTWATVLFVKNCGHLLSSLICGHHDDPAAASTPVILGNSIAIL